MRGSATTSTALHEIVAAVHSSLDLGNVLRTVVRLLSDASSVHACFVYLLADGERLVLAAASPPYEEHVDRVTLSKGGSLAWWSLEQGEPAFIRDDALSDSRMEYVPELEEERFQSLLAIPLLERTGAPIGVITAHTEAPREFSDEEVDFLVTGASLVAGAIENARLFEETRERVGDLEHVTELAEAIAQAEGLDEVFDVVTEGALPLLGASACHVYVLDDGGEELVRRRSAPDPAGAPPRLGLVELGPELVRGGRSARLAIPLVSKSELLGLLVAEGSDRVELGRTVASQAAVAIKKAELIERLAEKNLIKDFFEELAGGRRRGDLEGRAARLGCDLTQPHLVLVAEPPADRLERAVRTIAPESVFDRREESVRGLLRLPPGGAEALVTRLRGLHAQLELPAAIGLSSACAGEEEYPTGFAEAEQAVLGISVLAAGPAVLAYEELGPYKYLLRIAGDGSLRDETVDAVTELDDYDRRRGAQLLSTLEEFLRRHGSIAATSEALYVHPNTLRQRLRRIAELTGLDLRVDDWLMIEIAVKLVRLRQATRTAGDDTAATRPV